MDINNLLNEDFIDDSLKTNDFYDSENIENVCFTWNTHFIFNLTKN